MKAKKKHALIILLSAAAIIILCAIMLLLTDSRPMVEKNTSKAPNEKKGLVFADNGISSFFDPETGTLAFFGYGVIERSYRQPEVHENRSLIKTIIFNDGIKTISILEFSDFKEYNNLETVIFEGDVDTIEDYAFIGNEKLKKVEFRGKCGEIRTGAFAQCTSLKDINIPSGCEVAKDAFKGTPIEIPQTSSQYGFP